MVTPRLKDELGDPAGPDSDGRPGAAPTRDTFGTLGAGARRGTTGDGRLMAEAGRVRALVTGGAGFIGSHVVDAYVEAGLDVAIVDNLSTGSRANLNPAARLYE